MWKIFSTTDNISLILLPRMCNSYKTARVLFRFIIFNTANFPSLYNFSKKIAGKAIYIYIRCSFIQIWRTYFQYVASAFRTYIYIWHTRCVLQLIPISRKIPFSRYHFARVRSIKAKSRTSNIGISKRPQMRRGNNCAEISRIARAQRGSRFAWATTSGKGG